MPTNASRPYKPRHTAAQPRREIFDPWNTSSKGHQHAENRLSGSTSWRNSRTYKLNAQLGAGLAGGGGKRIADLVGAGSAEFGKDGRTDTGWDDSVRGWRGRQGTKGTGDVAEMIRHGDAKRCNGANEVDDQGENDSDSGPIPPPSAQLPNRHDEDEDGETEGSSNELETTIPLPTSLSRRTHHHQDHKSKPIKRIDSSLSKPSVSAQTPSLSSSLSSASASASASKPTVPAPPQIFSCLTIHIAGSTYPIISDHRLKYLLTSHGARLALTHARRQVTHVIVGRSTTTTPPPPRPNDSSDHPNLATESSPGGPSGPSGSLSGSKLQREIVKRSSGRGLSKGVRYVGVEWAVESVKAGRRLPEAGFPGLSVAGRGVRSVREMSGFVLQGR